MSSVAKSPTPIDLAAQNGAPGRCESVQEIISILATAEAFAVTALGVALENAANGKLPLNAEQQQAIKAARAEDQAHYAFLLGSGAKPLTTTFTLPDPQIVSDVPTFLKNLIALKELFVAAYLAAAQEFAVLGEATWVAHSLAIGAIEAEHRVAARFFAVEGGSLIGPPNDVAFERAKFSSVGAAAAELKALGFIGGSGTQITYPGAGSVDDTGVKHLMP